jgi:hypothetical protein
MTLSLSDFDNFLKKRMLVLELSVINHATKKSEKYGTSKNE